VQCTQCVCNTGDEQEAKFNSEFVKQFLLWTLDEGMNRRRNQQAAERVQTLLPFDQFVAALPTLQQSLELASKSDVYAVYCALHANGRLPVLEERCEGFYQLNALLPSLKKQEGSQEEVLGALTIIHKANRYHTVLLRAGSRNCHSSP
jgi:hypothetical protein